MISKRYSYVADETEQYCSPSKKIQELNTLKADITKQISSILETKSLAYKPMRSYHIDILQKCRAAITAIQTNQDVDRSISTLKLSLIHKSNSLFNKPSKLIAQTLKAIDEAKNIHPAMNQEHYTSLDEDGYWSKLPKTR